MERLTDEVFVFFSKIWTVVGLILLGLIGKLSIDVITGKKITFLQAFASTGAAFFVGIITHFYCATHNLIEEEMYIVPMTTLLSDKIIIAFMSVNYRKIVSDIAGYWKDYFGKS